MADDRNTTASDIYVVEHLYTDGHWTTWNVVYAGTDFERASDLMQPKKDWKKRCSVWRDGERQGLTHG